MLAISVATLILKKKQLIGLVFNPSNGKKSKALILTISGNPAAVSDTTTLILPLTLLFVLVIVLLVVAAVVLARKKGYMP